MKSLILTFLLTLALTLAMNLHLARALEVELVDEMPSLDEEYTIVDTYTNTCSDGRRYVIIDYIHVEEPEEFGAVAMFMYPATTEPTVVVMFEREYAELTEEIYVRNKDNIEYYDGILAFVSIYPRGLCYGRIDQIDL